MENVEDVGQVVCRACLEVRENQGLDLHKRDKTVK